MFDLIVYTQWTLQ